MFDFYSVTTGKDFLSSKKTKSEVDNLGHLSYEVPHRPQWFLQCDFKKNVKNDHSEKSKKQCSISCKGL